MFCDLGGSGAFVILRGFRREVTVESLKISTVFFSSVRCLAGGKFNSLAGALRALADQRGARRSPNRPLSASSRNSSPKRWLSLIAVCQY